MKKILCISGIFSVLLLLVLLTGWADADDEVIKNLRQGNRLYESGDYQGALESYETGLAARPDNQALCFNAAQAAYLLGEYEKAAQHYEKSGDSVEKYLNAGNIYFRAGEAAQENNLKAQCYAQALQIYQEGIIKFPQDVPLKYNYELVKEKIKEVSENSEQENSDQSEGESGDQNESGEKDDSSQESQEQKSEERENSQADQAENSDQDENAEQAQNSDQDENSDQAQNAGEESSEDEDGDEQQQESYSQKDGEVSPDQESVERILRVLENQEEQSLKNNQEVYDKNGDNYGW